MINKIENYLTSLKTKEVIYLFLSIPIVVFILYYNFVYPKLTQQHQNLQQQLKNTTKALSASVIQIRKLRKIDKLLPIIEKNLESKKENFKYIKYNLAYVDIIKLNNTKIYTLLENMLNKANSLNLNASFAIDWNQKYPPYNEVIVINITGNGEYPNIVRYLQYLENLNVINTINNLKIGFNNMEDLIKNNVKFQPFNITIELMGIK